MRRLPNSRRKWGFTIIDLMIVLCTVAGCALTVLPMFSRGRTTGCRVYCVSNLQQIGVSFRLNANDNDGHYPMSLSSSKGGTKEFTSMGETYRHFRAVGTELSSPKVLVCPEDINKIKVPDFNTNYNVFNNSNISYFIGLDADEANPGLLLAGDRNLRKSSMPKGAVMALSARSNVTWTKELHSRKSKEPCGNIGLADGSAQQVNNEKLRALLAQNPNVVQRLMLP